MSRGDHLVKQVRGLLIKGKEVQAAVLPGKRLFRSPDAFYAVSDKGHYVAFGHRPLPIYL